MHIIQYRLLTVVLISALLWTLFGCGRPQVDFVTDAESESIADVGDTEQANDLLIGPGEHPMVAESSEETGVSDATIPVYVCGAVKNPGVYYLPPGSLKKDALDMAGGFTENASMEYVNLAENISAGEQIYFPTLSEIEDWKPIYNTSGDSVEDGRVHINYATKEQLMTLPGIGESKAEAIIAYREQYGPFQASEDLLKVSGIKDGVYQRIKASIVVD